jgi:hypothetical protein
MTLEFEFEAVEDVWPQEMARALADVQHFVVALTLLAHADGRFSLALHSSNWVVNEGFDFSYKFMIAEARPSDFRDIGLRTRVEKISFNSPLKIEVSLDLPVELLRKVAAYATEIATRIWDPESTREARRIANAGAREEVIAKRLQNISTVLKIRQRVTDPKMRRIIDAHVASSMAPLDPAVPPDRGRKAISVKSLKVKDEDN